MVVVSLVIHFLVVFHWFFRGRYWNRQPWRTKLYIVCVFYSGFLVPYWVVLYLCYFLLVGMVSMDDVFCMGKYDPDKVFYATAHKPSPYLKKVAAIDPEVFLGQLVNTPKYRVPADFMAPQMFKMGNFRTNPPNFEHLQDLRLTKLGMFKFQKDTVMLSIISESLLHLYWPTDGHDLAANDFQHILWRRYMGHGNHYTADMFMPYYPSFYFSEFTKEQLRTSLEFLNVTWVSSQDQLRSSNPIIGDLLYCLRTHLYCILKEKESAPAPSNIPFYCISIFGIIVFLLSHYF